MPTGVIARRAKSANASNYEQIETLGGYRTAANEWVYAFNFEGYTKYYQGQTFKMFEATYTKIPEDNYGYIKGDANGDFALDIRDMIHFKKFQLKTVYQIEFFSVWFDRSKYTLGATDFTALKKLIWNNF